jgi:ligand-binding sensor domain-containing protein/two-component sensor histidine kinase
MSLSRSLLALAFCLSLVGHAHGSQPRISPSSLSGMLQQPTVIAIHRDRSGILWIGTQQGLHRFDGANSTVFDSDRDNKNWIPDSEVKDIAEDNDGNLLVVTSSGTLLRLDRHKETFDIVKEFGPDVSSTIRLLVSKLGRIWLLSKDGLILYDPRFQNTENWVKNLKLIGSIGRLHDVVEDESGNLWVGGSLGLAKVLPESKSFVAFDHEALLLKRSSRVTALQINSEGNLTIGTDTGQLLVWSVGSSTPLASSAIAGTAPHYISKFVAYEDKLIIATDRGLFASDNQLSSIEDLSKQGKGLSNPDIYSLFRDGKYIWVGTSDGLDKLSFSPFDLFNSSNSGIYNTVLAFTVDMKERIWITTYSGLYLFDHATGIHIPFQLGDGPNSLTHGDQGVATIAARGDQLWIGFFQGGVKMLDTVSGASHTVTLGRENTIAVTRILADDDSEDVWIATYDRGLFRWTAEETHSYYESQSLAEKTVTLLFRSKSDIFLAVSQNRVYQHNPKTDRFNRIRFEFDLGEIQPVIYSFAQAYNGDILIGTKDHGLFIWSRSAQLENQFVLQATVEGGGLTSSSIYGIEVDSESNLWCSTQNGIVKLDSKGRLIKRFTTADGLQGNDFALGASFTSRDGLIYFGGANGYNRFDPTEIDIDRTEPAMRMTSISLPKPDDRNTGAVDKLKSLQLTHKDYFVTFEFSVLDLVSPEKNQFRYILENFDPDWTESGTRNTATYTNLPSGDYVFRVQGANSAGIWNRTGITLDVHVLPSRWFTWWAVSTYGLLGLFILWCYRRISKSYAAEKKSARLTQQMLEAANQAEDDMQEQLELQDELVQSAFQHNLTTLSLVSDCISYRSGNQSQGVKHDLTEKSLKRIAALSSLEACLYYQSGGPVANLHKYTDGIIAALLNRSTVEPETIITINEVSSTLVPAQLASPLSVVIYELLENCILHAFEPGSPANYIIVKMSVGEAIGPSVRDLELSIQDSGIGIPDYTKDPGHATSGIAIVRSIVKKLGGTIQFSDSTVSITVPNPDNT